MEMNTSCELANVFFYGSSVPLELLPVTCSLRLLVLLLLLLLLYSQECKKLSGKGTCGRARLESSMYVCVAGAWALWHMWDSDVESRRNVNNTRPDFGSYAYLESIMACPRKTRYARTDIER